MSLYLVTGGAGFIGSNIVEELLRRGQRVRVLDNLSTGRRRNIEEFEGKIDLVEGDVRSYHTVQDAVQNADYILHQAALPSIPRSVRDPITTCEVNVRGTLNVLVAAMRANAKRFVFASSSSVYGNNATLPKKEDMIPEPLSPYAASKLAGEHYCRSFARIYGFETICLRYFNVFGPRQDPSSHYSAVVPKFIRLMLGGQAPTIYGDGRQTRDFTHVRDVVQGNLLACEAHGVSGEVFNIACGECFSLLELVDILNSALGTSFVPSFSKAQRGDVRHSLADTSKSESGLGYRPSIGIREGLERTVEHLRARVD